VPERLRFLLELQDNPTMSESSEVGLSHVEARPDDLSREVFGVMGLPLDALDLPTLLQILKIKLDAKTPFLLSTPNVNFLVTSRSDRAFRESLLMSDLCTVDGMPLVWIARLLGIPIKERLSGSDIFDALRSHKRTGFQLDVFLFGGAQDAAQSVSNKLNIEADGMKCVGTLNPGFGTIEDMSSDDILQSINSSGAGLLSVFLSARKAQGWLLLNHDRLQVPVRAQFGSAVNYQAGTIKRAPALFRHLGFEWLWRIKEEPYLWRRYWNDAGGLLKLFLTRVVPLSIEYHWRRLLGSPKGQDLVVELSENQDEVRITVGGAAIASNINLAIPRFRQALEGKKNVSIDLGDARHIDARFFGLFLMLRKQLVGQGCRLNFQGMTPRVMRLFRLNGFEYLLDSTD
jgi:N-acetylglucosaminyldiphosphoundecaprenol N-acetyl-beta-D-mannosaminyltransferase